MTARPCGRGPSYRPVRTGRMGRGAAALGRRERGGLGSGGLAPAVMSGAPARSEGRPSFVPAIAARTWRSEEVKRFDHWMFLDCEEWPGRETTPDRWSPIP